MGIKSVEVYGDSQLVITQLVGDWTFLNPKRTSIFWTFSNKGLLFTPGPIPLTKSLVDSLYSHKQIGDHNGSTCKFDWKVYGSLYKGCGG